MRQFRQIAAVAIVLLAAIVLVLSGARWDAVIYRLAVDGSVAVVWLAAALGLGALASPLLKRTGSPIALRLMTEWALGIGLIGLITLALGLAGVLSTVWAWGILLAGLILLAIRIWRHRRFQVERCPPSSWLWLLIVPPLAVVLVAACVPPGLLWGDEPNGYDVAEYHLQIPREWRESGRINAMDHNVFSFFPQGVEMHYLLAMHLRAGPWAGMFV
ncbi:MAG: hypothetical protein ACREJC_08680, partial [Tepidisphaeraceae bacterium]